MTTKPKAKYMQNGRTPQANASYVKEIVRRTRAQLLRGDSIAQVSFYLVGAILQGGQKNKILEELAKTSSQLVAETKKALAEHDRLKALRQIKKT
ncbi:hypothetical protein [Aeromonas veronii]|uniref:Uncharacterized protein n=1 Tax=Aeromonas veronii TaxID=654 RepID=A0A4S5CKG2_AERVE|nr:hypothetical protein [Aeromonas veronii]THJ45113.1 hypothetical protein E8Q35_13100 [Aeromonas veronii]